MKFPSIKAAQLWSSQHGKHIYVEIENAVGVLEVYPGGRKIWWDDSGVNKNPLGLSAKLRYALDMDN